MTGAMGNNNGWTEYQQKLKGSPPRPSLVRALERIGEAPPQAPPRLAINLGCGAGQDTLELLQRGWRVVAVDSSPKAGDLITSVLDPEARSRLEFRHARFEEVELPSGAALINASFSLPFCAKEAFPAFWSKIRSALAPVGWFAGQFFGPEDDWVRDGSLTGHSEDELREMFRGFRVNWKLEDLHCAAPAVGLERDWHVFTVIVTLSHT